MFTTLTKQALPIIRYRSHCGSTASPHSTLELTRWGHLDCLTVNIEPTPGLTAVDAQRASAELIREVKIRMGTTVEARLVQPGSLAHSRGKIQRVQDRR